jgi:hypothetical protein
MPIRRWRTRHSRAKRNASRLELTSKNVSEEADCSRWILRKAIRLASKLRNRPTTPKGSLNHFKNAGRIQSHLRNDIGFADRTGRAGSRRRGVAPFIFSRALARHRSLVERTHLRVRLQPGEGLAKRLRILRREQGPPSAPLGDTPGRLY